jgi:hypothetical protein
MDVRRSGDWIIGVVFILATGRGLLCFFDARQFPENCIHAIYCFDARTPGAGLSPDIAKLDLEIGDAFSSRSPGLIAPREYYQ